MKYSVNLENPFAFSSYWYGVGTALIVIAVVLFLITPRILNRFERKNLVSLRQGALTRTRNKFLKKIDEIEAAYNSGKLDTRGVCQQMSIEVRRFVRAVTGWPTETMVYLELVRLDRPELAELVRQYYEPEFAYFSDAAAKAAIEKGKELIIKWA